MKKSLIKHIGKRGKAWIKTRQKLKKIFEKQDITTCELRYEGCFINNFLSFAHSKRRRFIADESGLAECILACTPCHQKLDSLPHSETYRIVTEIIENRV